MKFKESLFCKYEKSFVNEVISEGRRLDGRLPDEYRKLDIQFGKDWGVVIVSLGETKVMAQVTCDVQQPKTTRPNEGLLFLNVELNQMAVPNIEQNILSELLVHLNRLLEKCIKESHCVDLESLCIVAEEKVWNIRVDIIVLNYEGNVVGCSSIAAIAALSHFRRPDVTIDGEKVIIHSPAEKDVIPLSMHHYPVCISYAIFENGRFVLSDPTDIEERSAQAELVLGMNAYRELCGIHLSGTVLQELNVLLACARKGADTATRLVQQIKMAIETDEKQRKEKLSSCLVENIKIDRQLQVSENRSTMTISNLTDAEMKDKAKEIVNLHDTRNVVILSDGENDVEEITEINSSGFQSAEIVHRKRYRSKKQKQTTAVSTWSDNDDASDNDDESGKILGKGDEDKAKNDKKEVIDTDSDESDIALVREITTEDRIIERIELTGDSEEEDVITMMPADIENIDKNKLSINKNEIKNESD